MRRTWVEIIDGWTYIVDQDMSSSMRRTWVEILTELQPQLILKRRPPCGGRGLKWDRDRSKKIYRGRPPCGGRGLKLL